MTRTPEILLNAIVSRERSADDGHVVHALAPAWLEIKRVLRSNPAELLSLSPRQWEELIAASYDKAGFEEVILTPRSGDSGRDVIAIKRGWGSVRILDQVKAYKPGHIVTADAVRALIGVVLSDLNATKGIVTTTSDFAPRIATDPSIAPLIPYRLELVNGKDLFARLAELSRSPT